MDKSDEISIRELWEIVAKRKLLFWIVFLVLVSIGIGFSLVKPNTYRYSQGIQVAGYYGGDQVVPLESVKDIVAKIKVVYLPAVIGQYNLNHKYRTNFHPDNFTIVFTSGGLIVLSIKGTAAEQPIFVWVIKKLARDIHADTSQLVRFKNEYFSNYLKLYKEQLAAQLRANKNLLEVITGAVSEKNAVKQLLSAQILAASGRRQVITELMADINSLQIKKNSLRNTYILSAVSKLNIVGFPKFILIFLSFMSSFIISILIVLISGIFLGDKKQSHE